MAVLKSQFLGHNFILLQHLNAEKAMAIYSGTLAWEIPWMEKPGRLQSMGSLRVRHDWVTSLSLFTLMHWRRKWQPTPVFLPGESQGREPCGLPSMGLQSRTRLTWLSSRSRVFKCIIEMQQRSAEFSSKRRWNILLQYDRNQVHLFNFICIACRQNLCYKFLQKFTILKVLLNLY